MIIIGFTSTRQGLTNQQSDLLWKILSLIRQKSEKGKFNFYHGDAIGGDDQAHQIAVALNLRIETFPSNIDSQRAFNKKGTSVRHGPKDPLYRNKKILINSHRLIACPRDFIEEKRSGTWSTIRLAQRMDLPTCIIWPDGFLTSAQEYKDAPFNLDKWIGPTIINSNGN